MPTGSATYRQDQPRMPWQDVQVRIEGPSVYDLSQNFIRRWNSVQKSYLPRSDVGRSVTIFYFAIFRILKPTKINLLIGKKFSAWNVAYSIFFAFPR